MLIGNPNIFAVHLTDQQQMGVFVHCGLVIKIAGGQIGDPSRSGVLGSTISKLYQLTSQYRGKREINEFQGLSIDEKFYAIYDALYGENNDSDEQLATALLNFQRFDISDIHPSLDRFHIFLVESQHTGLLLWRELTLNASAEFVPSDVNSAIIPAGLFDDVADQLIQAVNVS